MTVIDKIGDHPIGCGGFADVWKGRMHDIKGGPNSTSLVALKILRSVTSSWSVEDLTVLNPVSHY